MPDLDDIFEDVFDFVKKQWRKQQKSKKQKNKKKDGKKSSTSPDRRPPRAADESAPASLPPQRSVTGPSSTNLATSSAVKSSGLRGYMEQARAYETGILELMHNAPTEFNRARMEELTRYITHWQNSLQALVTRVDQFQQNDLLQRDLKDVPKAIQRIEAQLSEEVPKRVENELRRTLTNRQQQLRSLTDLQETMQWAEVKIESTVSMLGTLYSQSAMSQSEGQLGSYQRLLSEIEEETLSLDDYLTMLKEIKFGGSSS